MKRKIGKAALGLGLLSVIWLILGMINVDPIFNRVTSGNKY